MEKRTDAIAAIGVFGCAALLLWWLIGTRLVLINDEGIYLEGARRMLGGEYPYRDFFALTGPGTFWNVALFFKLFGVSLASARLLLIADLALIAACLFWLTAKLQSKVIAFWLAWFYISLLAADAGRLVVNHRWDSAALSTAAVALLLHGLRAGRAWPVVVAGVAAGCAAWITPPVLLLILPMLAWAFFEDRWVGAGRFCAGVAGVSALAVCALLATNSLAPMANHLLWSAAQYSGANRIIYGGITGGYRALFSDTHGIEALVRGYFVLFFVLPALVPIVAGLGLLASRKLRNRQVIFLSLCAAAAVIACAPRMDVAHLTFGAPLSYVLATCALATLMPARIGFMFVVALSFGASIMAGTAIMHRTQLESMGSRVGTLVGEHDEIALTRDLDLAVQPGQSFFAFPYVPLAYFLTLGENPTRYSFLQPGMMADADERSVVTALDQSPPLNILYMDVSENAFLRLFPSSDPSRLRLYRIEAWLKENYDNIEPFSRAHPGYNLLRRRSSLPVPGSN